jgi:membrane-associated protease RseP (regulator of RpoE activity)
MNDDPQHESAEGADLPRPGAEAPTVPVESVPVDEPTATTPVATATPSGQPAPRKGVLVPTWALVTVSGLLLLVIGGLVGYAIGSNDGGGHDRAADGFVVPGRLPEGLNPFAGGNGPFGNGNGNGNGNGSNDDGEPAAPRANGAFLGVAVRDASNPAGAELMRVVAGSPASDAGLKTSDVITAVDDHAVADAAALTTRIGAHSPGDKVVLTYRRDGASKTVTVTLSDRTPTTTQ